MRKRLAVLTLALLTVSPLFVMAQRSAGSDPDVSNIMKLERQVWEAWQKHDLPALKTLTARDYLSVNETGATTWSQVEAAFADFELSSFTLGEMHALRVSRDVVIISYPAEIHGSVNGLDVSRTVAECSVWRRQNVAGKMSTCTRSR
jgi:Domain of unknown function (DUF4440)